MNPTPTAASLNSTLRNTPEICEQNDPVGKFFEQIRQGTGAATNKTKEFIEGVETMGIF